MDSARDSLLRRAVDWFAENGVGDTSLRAAATGMGSSHRMLHYHFGSREGLLAAVVAEVWRRHRTAFEGLLGDVPSPTAAWTFWTRLADDPALAALNLELTAAAAQGRPWAVEQVREQLDRWEGVLTTFFERLGNPGAEATLLARTSMAVVRGTLELLAVDRDRRAADAVVAGFLETLARGPSAPRGVDRVD